MRFKYKIQRYNNVFGWETWHYTNDKNCEEWERIKKYYNSGKYIPHKNLNRLVQIEPYSIIDRINY